MRGGEYSGCRYGRARIASERGEAVWCLFKERKREMQRLIITVDGPAGTGKSTAARLLAHRLGLEFLDTGAMYRGVTAAAVEAGIHLLDADAVTAFAQSLEMHFDWQQDPPRLHVNGQDLTDRLRDADTTALVSDVAPIPGVRRVLVALQQKIGTRHPRLVTEGRDQGSVVFPDAQIKFYLDASPQLRARRRADQLREAGKPADEMHILEAIIERDRRDSTRADGPLICPHDAIRIDTSEMVLEQVVNEMERQVRSDLD